MGEIIAGTAVEPYPPVALAGDDAEAICFLDNHKQKYQLLSTSGVQKLTLVSQDGRLALWESPAAFAAYSAGDPDGTRTRLSAGRPPH